MALEPTDFKAPLSIDWSPGGHVGLVDYGQTKGMVALFYTDAVHHKQKSLAMGYPVYIDTIMVRIAPPGENLNVVVRPATRQDAQRFPIQWAQFKQNQEQIPDGMKIEMLYPETPSIGATLKAHGVHTVEQCAELSSTAIDAIGMGAQRWHNDAVRFLEQAQKGVTASKFRKEMEERDIRIQGLERQLQAAVDEIARMRGDRLTQNGVTPAAGQPSMSELIAQEVRKALAGGIVRPVVGDTPLDPAVEMINATSATAEIERQAEGNPKKSRRRKPA